jgi:hypothetical protein
MHKNSLLVGFIVLILTMMACNSTSTPAGPSQAEQATQVAAQVETRIAELTADQNATRAVEDAVATAVASLAAEATHTTTPTPTVPTAVINPTLAPTNPPLPTNPPPPPTNTVVPPTHTSIPPTNTPLPPTETPIPPTATTQVIYQTVIVRESDTAVDALYLLPADQVTISASGEIWSGVAFTGTNGPDGWDSTDCDPKFPLPCVHPFSLLYRANGPYVEGGSWSQFTHTGSATMLTLRINDDAPGNGSGSFTVTVTVVR